MTACFDNVFLDVLVSNSLTAQARLVGVALVVVPSSSPISQPESIISDTLTSTPSRNVRSAHQSISTVVVPSR